MKQLKLSLNQQAFARLAQVLVGLIIVAIVGYSEVMFLQIMAKAFPDGFFKIVAIMGGVATGLSVLTLLISKAYWFRPGGQTVAAWLFTAVEVLVLMLNVLLSFALAQTLDPSMLDPFMASWYTLCPSSPLVALVGWILIIQLDRSQQERHEELELEAEMQQAEREHRRAVHEAKMKLKRDFLQSQSTYLQHEVDSDEMQRAIQHGARVLAMEELSSLIGQHVSATRHAQLSAPQTTDELPDDELFYTPDDLPADMPADAHANSSTNEGAHVRFRRVGS